MEHTLIPTGVDHFARILGVPDRDHYGLEKSWAIARIKHTATSGAQAQLPAVQSPTKN